MSEKEKDVAESTGEGRSRRRNLPKIKPPNLKTQVYDLILDFIVDGKYRDNDMLPPERILCEELGVSRTVVREAIKSLETRGILTVIHGKGIKVNPSNSHDIANAFMLYLRRENKEASMSDLMEGRYAIETEIARLAAKRANEADLKRLRVTLQEMDSVLGDVKKFVFMDIDFHLQLAIISKNILFITIAEALVIPLRHSREETVSAEDNVLAQKQHTAICKSIELHDHELAYRQMSEHLKHVEEVLRAHGKL